jgi:prepilin peptidase CpaA
MLPALSVLAIAVFAAAAITDSLRRRIPNILSAALALLGAARIALALAAGGGVAAFGLDVLAAFAIFVMAAFGFRFGMLGGGDVKLLAAGVLWLGAAALLPYLAVTALAGGVLAVLFVTWQMARPRSSIRDTGPSLPYGVAIAAGGILTTAGALWA